MAEKNLPLIAEDERDPDHLKKVTDRTLPKKEESMGEMTQRILGEIGGTMHQMGLTSTDPSGQTRILGFTPGQITQIVGMSLGRTRLKGLGNIAPGMLLAPMGGAMQENEEQTQKAYQGRELAKKIHGPNAEMIGALISAGRDVPPSLFKNPSEIPGTPENLKAVADKASAISNANFPNQEKLANIKAGTSEELLDRRMQIQSQLEDKRLNSQQKIELMRENAANEREMKRLQMQEKLADKRADTGGSVKSFQDDKGEWHLARVGGSGVSEVKLPEGWKADPASSVQKAGKGMLLVDDSGNQYQGTREGNGKLIVKDLSGNEVSDQDLIKQMRVTTPGQSNAVRGGVRQNAANQRVVNAAKIVGEDIDTLWGMPMRTPSNVETSDATGGIFGKAWDRYLGQKLQPSESKRMAATQGGVSRELGIILSGGYPSGTTEEFVKQLQVNEVNPEDDIQTVQYKMSIWARDARLALETLTNDPNVASSYRETAKVYVDKLKRIPTPQELNKRYYDAGETPVGETGTKTQAGSTTYPNKEDKQPGKQLSNDELIKKVDKLLSSGQITEENAKYLYKQLGQ